jgi:hypothetical protein
MNQSSHYTIPAMKLSSSPDLLFGTKIPLWPLEDGMYSLLSIFNGSEESSPVNWNEHDWFLNERRLDRKELIAQHGLISLYA